VDIEKASDVNGPSVSTDHSGLFGPSGATIEAQQMVRRVKTYTIVDSEFNSLAVTTITGSLMFFFASVFISIGIDCLITQMSIAPETQLQSAQTIFFYYGTRIGFSAGAVFFFLTVCFWIFGWSIFRHVKRTSREGKIIGG
jgi:hypothetical protein